MTDLASAQFLRLGRESEECIYLALGEEFHRLRRGARDPIDILHRIEPDMRSHAAQKRVLARAQALHAYGLPLQIRDAADAFSREQLEAADMLASHYRDRLAGIDRDNQRRREISGEVDLAARERHGGRNPG